MYLAEYLLSIRELLPEEDSPGEILPEETMTGQLLSYGLSPGKSVTGQILPHGPSTEKRTGEKVLSRGYSEEYREALIARAFSCVDEERRRKAEQIRPGRARAASLGAGLLLQLAVGEALCGNVAGASAVGNAVEIAETLYRNVTEGSEAGSNADMEGAVDRNAKYTVYSVSRLLARLEKLPHQSLTYRYGKKGKPYFRDLPYYFSLSHSGDYVFCALSTEEIGADIQQHRRQLKGDNRRRLAERFFSEEEKRALEVSGEREELFYRLWTRKEAFGKLTGEGVAGILDVNLLPADSVPNARGMSLKGKMLLKEEALSGKSVSSEDGAPSEEDMLQENRGRTGQEKGAPAREKNLPPGRQLIWKEYENFAGYSIALCYVSA